MDGDEPATNPTRERLLEAALAYVTENGIGDVGFRELARALGTTHRALGYHFGSKDGLLVEIVRTVEQRQRDALAALVAEAEAGPDDDGDGPVGVGAVDAGPVDQMRRMAERLVDPSLWANERLFFEVYGQALQGRPYAADLLPEVVTAWIGPLTDICRRLGTPEEDAPAQARLLLAVARGLLLDLVATGDQEILQKAGDMFFDMLERGSRRPGVRPAADRPGEPG
jgi:AcrR family transcriptional regulator